MAKEIEKQEEQAVVEQLTNFEIVPSREEITLTKDDTVFKVTPHKGGKADVTVNDTGRGVQVSKPAALAEGQQAPKASAINFEDDDYQIVTTQGVTLSAHKNVPATVATDGNVILVNEAQAAADAAEKGTEPEAAAETGVWLSFDKNNATGGIDGNEFKIGLYTKDIDVYANRTLVKAAAVPTDATDAASTDEAETVSADEAETVSTDEAVAASANAADAATADAGKIKISLSKDFNRAVIEGLNGTKVIIELGKKGAKDAKDIVYTTGDLGSMPAADAPDADVPGIKVNGDMTRLILADGKVYDVNTVTGDVTRYGGGAKLGKSSKLNEAEPENLKNHRIVISENGTRLDLNKSSVEKTADGLAVATDAMDPREGIVQLKSVDQSPSAVAAAEAKIGQAAGDGWVFLVKIGDQQINVASEDSGLMTRRQVRKLIKKLKKDNEGVDLPDEATLKLMFAHAAKIGGFKTEGSYDETHYMGQDCVSSFKHGGLMSKVGMWDKANVRVVCFKPA